MIFRKTRTMEDFHNDPAFVFNAVHLIGTTGVVAHWMQLQDDPQTKAMGEHLERSLSLFQQGETIDSSDSQRKRSSAETRT